MEEQTTQTVQQSTASQAEPQATFDDSADGATYSGYDTESAMPDTDVSDSGMPDDGLDGGTDGNTDSGELAPDGIGLDEYGDIKLGDSFFKDIPKNDEGEAPEGTKQPPVKPNYYTDEELKATPYERWDMNRVGGDVGRYAQEVQRQIQQRQSQALAQAIQNVPIPSDITEVKPYTPKELSEAAKKLAIEKLGLEDPEDFDDYEGEHRAAMSLAMNELMSKRNAEVSNYQRGQAEWGQLQKFNLDLAQLPDFNDFNQWYMGKLQEAGVTAEQVNLGLYNYARQPVKLQKTHAVATCSSRGKSESCLGGMVDGVSEGLDKTGLTFWNLNPEPTDRIARGIPNRTNRLKALGNAVVPQQAYPIFKAIMEADFDD